MSEHSGGYLGEVDNGSDTLAVIAARSGSKGLPDKNVKKLAGVPLLGWSIAYARLHGLPSIVSTDSESYAMIARALGADIPHLRSKDLSGDGVRSAPVVIDALDRAEGLWGRSFRFVVLLEPTSPFRSAGLLNRARASLAQGDSGEATSVVSVVKAGNWHPNFALTYSEDDNTLVRSAAGDLTKRRQELSTVFYPDGSLYLSSTDSLRDRGSFYQDNMPLLEVGCVEANDIDDLSDFNFCELVAGVLLGRERHKFELDFSWMRDSWKSLSRNCQELDASDSMRG